MTRVVPIVALDVPDAADALRLVSELSGLCDYFKIGSELYTAAGPEIVRDVQARGASVFLDLKFHDIPNTVRGAVRSAARLGVRMLTVHASGGAAMLEAAVAGVGEAGSDCRVFAVSVLTSLDAGGLAAAWGRPAVDVRAEVLRLARLVVSAGVPGLVCSGQEAREVRAAVGGELALLVPGVRLASGERQDQSRVVTPREAADAGADYIVVGRAVTAAADRRAAMSAVLADLP